ncbi:MAG: hypothetical protein ACOYEI_03045 [Acetivibrionales bacterium]|jgi:hypothetical protein
MKRNNLRIFLIIEAVICTILAFMMENPADSFITIMSFPFAQIGEGLRALSLSGISGNIAAIVIYAALCILPVIYLIIRKRKGRAHIEDGLLVIISLLLFVVIYMMINPVDIAIHFGNAVFMDSYKGFMGAAVYSVIAGYIIIRVLRQFLQCGTDDMLRYLKILLSVVCAFLIYRIFASGLSGLKQSFSLLAAQNTDGGGFTETLPLDSLFAAENSEGGLFLSYVFLAIQYLVDILPYAFNIIIIFTTLALLDALEKDSYSQEVTTWAQKTGGVCRIAILAIMLSQIVVNILQLALGSLIRSSYYTLNIPLLSVIFMLVVMLFAKYFEKARELKNENDSII